MAIYESEDNVYVEISITSSDTWNSSHPVVMEYDKFAGVGLIKNNVQVGSSVEVNLVTGTTPFKVTFPMSALDDVIGEDLSELYGGMYGEYNVNIKYPKECTDCFINFFRIGKYHLLERLCFVGHYDCL